MLKKGVLLSTVLFVGGFIPLANTVKTVDSIQFQIYADEKEENAFFIVNQAKYLMLECYHQFQTYSFSQTDEQLKANVHQFENELVCKSAYDNYTLKLYLNESDRITCYMRGTLYQFDKEQKSVEKSYFFKELFR